MSMLQTRLNATGDNRYITPAQGLRDCSTGFSMTGLFVSSILLVISDDPTGPAIAAGLCLLACMASTCCPLSFGTHNQNTTAAENPYIAMPSPPISSTKSTPEVESKATFEAENNL